MWDNSSPPWVGWRDGGYREGARRATRRAITTVRTSSRKGSGSLAGYEQSPRGASTGAAGNGLDANTLAEQPKRTYVGAKGTGARLPLFTVWDGCALLYTRDACRLPHGRHVCYCTRTPRNNRSEHARAPYTWARPPTCTPYRSPD